MLSSAYVALEDWGGVSCWNCSATADDGSRDPHALRLFSEGVPTSETPAQTAVRQSVGSEADFGHGGSDQEVYYGVKVQAAVDNVGFLTGWVVGPASTEEHWLAVHQLKSEAEWRRC